MTSALDFIISGEGSVYITMTLLALVCTYMQFSPSFAPAPPQEKIQRAQAFSNIRSKREEVPESTAQTNMPRKRIVVSTELGDVHVNVIGNPSEQVNFFTLPELGLTHRGCFNSFFESARHLRPFSSFCICHIDLPGLHEGDSDLSVEKLQLEDMVSVVEAVRQQLEIKSFVAVGVGLGANIFLRYTAQYVNHVQALVLTGATHQTPDSSESLTYSILMRWISTFGMTNYVQKVFMSLLFSDSFIAAKPHMIQGFKRELADLNVNNLLLWIKASSDRKPISVSALKRISLVPLLFLTGTQPPYGLPALQYDSDQDHAIDMIQHLDRKKASWIEIPQGGRVLFVDQSAGRIEKVQDYAAID